MNADAKNNEYYQDTRIDIKNRDRPWAWVVCAAAFVTTTITDGIVFSFSVFIDNFVQHFNSDHKTIGFLGSTLMCLSCGLAGLIGSSLTKLLGCRLAACISTILTSLGILLTVVFDNLIATFIFFGVIAGLAAGVTIQQTMNIIPQWFKFHTSLAYGLSTCGAGLRTLFFVSLSKYLINCYGWRGALLILCGISLNCLPCVLLFRRNDQDSEEVKNAGTLGRQMETNRIPRDIRINCKTSNDETPVMIKNDDANINAKVGSKKIYPISKVFSKFAFFIYPTIFTLYLGLYIPYVFLYDKFVKTALGKKDQSLEENVALIVSLSGLPSSLSRLITGWLADKRFIRKSLLFSVVAILAGLYSMISFLYTDFVSMTLYSLEIGFTTGTLECLMPLMCLEIFPLKFSVTALGLLMVFKGFGILIGAPIAGLIFDYSGSYDVAFYLCGSCLIISSLIACPIVFLIKK